MYRSTTTHIVAFAFYGVYFVVFILYLAIAGRYPHKTRASYTLFAAMLLLFVSCTAQFTMDLVYTLQLIEGYLMSSAVPVENRKAVWAARHGGVFYVLERWPTAINFLISDLIVIWRAAVVYTHSKRRKTVWVGLGVMAIADIVSWLCAAAITSRDAQQRAQDPTTDEGVNTLSNFISLGTNLVGTAAIAFKAWQQKQLMKQASVLKWRGNVPRILLLLIETGACWAAVQLVFGILQQLNTMFNTSLDLATAVIAKIAVFLAAILPTATVIIVRVQRSVDYTLHFDDSGPIEGSSTPEQNSYPMSSGGSGSKGPHFLSSSESTREDSLRLDDEER
ncbi:hypothetical protein C8F01DRAFT_1145210 [Mycena amicta]|nr:hypothetical protein C8F01DRAFT_1145210 [Mycena amicta]